MPTPKAPKILLVEPDPTLLEIIVSSLIRRFDAQVTCVADAGSCLDVELIDPHALIIAEFNLRDGDGVDLASRLMSLGSKPFILLADDPDGESVIAALRSGVRDVFSKPFALEDLLDSAGKLLREQRLTIQRMVKHRNMRDLVRRVIHERRDINRRVELVCRDLVGAHRRLVHRVVDLESNMIRQSN